MNKSGNIGLNQEDSYKILYLTIFVKHELKGVLKCIRVEIWTHHPGPPPQTVTDGVPKKASQTVTDGGGAKSITDVTDECL